MAPTMPDMPMSDAETPAEGGDLAQGYCIEISVLPDGSFKVSGPEALEVEAAADQGEAPYSEVGEDFTSIGEALKQVLTLIKQNPVGGEAQANFEAGYAR